MVQRAVGTSCGWAMVARWCLLLGHVVAALGGGIQFTQPTGQVEW